MRRAVVAVVAVLRRRARIALGSSVSLLVASCGAAPPGGGGVAGVGGAGGKAPTSAEGAGAATGAQADASCTLRTPSSMPSGASALHVPPELYARAFAALVPAVCACTGADDALTLALAIRPNEGDLRASAPDRADVDACLAARLAPGRFEPVAVDGGDCIDCGPRHVATPARPRGLDRYAALRPAAATRADASAHAGVVVRVSVRVDRPHGLLADPATTHEPGFVDARGVE
jgi:hypothetical protein